MDHMKQLNPMSSKQLLGVADVASTQHIIVCMRRVIDLYEPHTV